MGLGDLLVRKFNHHAVAPVFNDKQAEISWSEMEPILEKYGKSSKYMGTRDRIGSEDFYRGVQPVLRETEFQQLMHPRNRKLLSLREIKEEIDFFTMDEFKKNLRKVIDEGFQTAQKNRKKNVLVAIPLDQHGGGTGMCQHGFSGGGANDDAWNELFCKS